MAARKKKSHPLDAVGAAWTPSYPGERKPLVLYSDAELAAEYPHRVGYMDALYTRNAARDLAEALARANGRLADIGPIASRQIRTLRDGGIFEKILRRPFQIALWFENAGPLSDEAYYPAFSKVYDRAEENLKKLGGFKNAMRESYNAAITVWYLTPEIWA